MYIYKALVGHLPRTNQMKLVNMINQHSDEIVQPVNLTEYDYGIVCQSQATYVGVFLVKVVQGQESKEFHVSHFGMVPSHRGVGNGSAMLALLKEEATGGDSVVVKIPVDCPSWKKQKLETWGFQSISSETDGNFTSYQLQI